MRKSFYSLSGIVANEMRRDVRDGEAFIFINRSLTSSKILHAEYGHKISRRRLSETSPSVTLTPSANGASTAPSRILMHGMRHSASPNLTHFSYQRKNVSLSGN